MPDESLTCALCGAIVPAREHLTHSCAARHRTIPSLVDHGMLIGGLVGRLRKADAMRDLEEDEVAEALEQQPGIEPGDTIRLTAERARMMYGVDIWGSSRAPDDRWRVVECDCGLCELGRHLAVEGGRHFAREAVERVKASPAGPVGPHPDLRFEESGVWLTRWRDDG